MKHTKKQTDKGEMEIKNPSLHLSWSKSFGVLAVLLLLFCTSVYAQETAVTGTVLDADGIPLPGASVVVKGTTRGAQTDFDGNYTIEANVDDILMFSYIGYASQEIPIDNQSTINVTLAEDMAKLDEVVVIGYGTKSRRLLTSAITSVSAEELAETPNNTIESVLQGKASGVSIQSQTGQPGANATIRIRGGSSINKDNDPLFIIDGVQRSSEDFNPDDIESVEILKDAAATAIYGSRASNGVVLVTTKSGKVGKVNINLHQRTSFSQVANRLDLLNATDYLRIERAGLTKSFLDENSAFGTGQTSTGTGNLPSSNISTRFLGAGENIPAGFLSLPDPVTGQTLIYTDTDWQDVIFNTAVTFDTNVSVDGGSEKIRYYTGFAYTDQGGVAKGTGYQRYSVQSNLDFQLTDKLKMDVTMNFTKSQTDEPQNAGELFGRSLRLAPTTRLTLADGTTGPGIRENLQNPKHLIENYLQNEDRFKFNLGTSLAYNILDNLVFTGRVNYLKDQTMTDNFTKANFFSRARNARARNLEQEQTQMDATLDYSKTFGEDHNFSILVGASRLKSDFFSSDIQGSGAGTDNIQTLNASSTILDASTLISKDLLIGYFSRLSYDYKGKYLFSGTIRRDGSSRFGANNKIGYFPGVSLGWRISDEEFYPEDAFVSDFKLRGSWGETANNEVGDINNLNRFFIAQGIIDPSLQYNGGAAARPTQLPNDQLGWETTTQTNVGADLALVDNRIRLSADYYRKLTEDLLFTRPLPNTSGFASVESNIGSVRFSGFEFEISSTNISTDDFNWTTNFNMAFTDNEIISLPENDLDRNRIDGDVFSDGFIGIGGIAEGEKLGQIVGYQFEKVYATTAEAQADGLTDMIANDRTDANGIDYRNRVGGDVKWRDVNGDNLINEEDQVVLGNTNPDIIGGFGNTLNYKGFELYVFADFALGHSIVNQNRYRMNSNSQGNINGTSDLLNAWSQEGDVTDIPRFVFFDFGNASNFHRPDRNTTGGGFIGPSSQSVEDADYVSLRTVRLSYNFPQSLLEKIGFSRAKLYLTGQNLHYFTKYKGSHPEAALTSNGVDGGRYPLFSTFTLGANVSF